ncbi:hypothetical protein C8N35_10138 [Breoghania corrubedonensis]|uniref:Uncharacterized protein n=1 Tax=Breoghania corrubedonensis TaxID=665038 RepID=A0A2T5VE56_9HYPH|nr:hypothetical protein C8N35_10138 [Breoghania corrubedonensis]
MTPFATSYPGMAETSDLATNVSPANIAHR